VRRELSGIQAEICDNDQIFVGERGGKLQNWDRWLKLLSRKTGISGWSAHTLRRTAATLAAELGAEPHVVSVLLGHKNVGGQLTASYSKSRYRREHAEALQRLAEHIDGIETGVSNVKVLRRGYAEKRTIPKLQRSFDDDVQTVQIPSRMQELRGEDLPPRSPRKKAALLRNAIT
jgi:hypothetical protein